MSANELKASALNAYQGFQTGTLDPLMTMLSNSIEWTNYEDSPLGGTYHGKAEVLAYIQKSTELTDLIKFELESLMCEGNKMIGVLNVAYRVKATGKIHEGTDVHLIDIKDDKVVRIREIVPCAAEAWS